MAIKSGDAIGDYKVIDLAGSGGMGAVYKIEHLITKRVEAMKLLPIGIDSWPEQVQRFEREIQVQARLHHPNIAALYNAVRDGRSIALIMEYVEGECLQRMLERGGLPLHTSVDYAGQILDALTYAHEMGVVHRDVSPANIIITPDGTAKLMDFGLARAATDLSLTSTGVAMGSPWYMSPEQVRALGELDARTDIYAMGAVLHEMLTGGKLFAVDGSFAVMRAQMETVPQPPSACNPQVPRALDEVVARALAKDPTARFQSAGEFRLALESAVGRMRPSGAASKGKPAPNKPAPNKPALEKRIKAYAARLAAFISALRLRGVQSSYAAALLVLVCAALMAVVCTVLLRPKATPVAVPNVPREAVVSKPAVEPAPPEPAAAEPAPPEPAPPEAVAVVRTPEVRVKAAKPAPRSAVSDARSMRRANKPDQSFAIPASSGVVEPPAPPPPPSTPLKVPEPPQETPALKPVEAVAHATPPVREASVAKTEPEAGPQISEEGKPQKTRKGFMRALGKLNPFRKAAKSDSTDPVPAKD